MLVGDGGAGGVAAVGEGTGAGRTGGAFADRRGGTGTPILGTTALDDGGVGVAALGTGRGGGCRAEADPASKLAAICPRDVAMDSREVGSMGTVRVAGKFPGGGWRAEGGAGTEVGVPGGAFSRSMVWSDRCI